MKNKLKNNNQLKNAFTLIELLGVLILLAVIALITFPIIDKVLSNAKNEAYERQKDSIIEAARMYVTTNGNYSTSQTQLSFQTLIDAGFLKEGEILDPRDSSKEMPGCVMYNWSESKNQYMFEYSEECKISYVLGDLLKVQVSDSETQNIYVLEVNGDEIVGLLDRNLGGAVDWISIDDYNNVGGNFESDNITTMIQNLYKFGPITANNALNERTSSWTNVKEKKLPSTLDLIKTTKFYQELSDKSNWESEYYAILDKLIKVKCDDISSCRQVLENEGFGDVLLPDWMVINLGATLENDFIMGYWTTNISSFNVEYNAYIWFTYLVWCFQFHPYYGSNSVGIRPIITISQSNIVEKLES